MRFSQSHIERRFGNCFADGGRRTAVSRRGRRGFSFIEVMIAVVIIGLLAGAVALKVGKNAATARHNRASSDIGVIVTALETHRLNTGRLPSVSQGLDSVSDSVTHIKDPWGNDYEYFVPGSGGAEFEVISYGADGREGGTDGDADISSLTLGTNHLDGQTR